ncbi:MAG TPA: DNA polymerase III subunit delta' [Pyrinomonadaceae bacterium]|nr:DNA polymerase III subunit delta' [Pyrinomonadaceae bacterium]
MFDHLLGNQRVKDILRRMLSVGRTPGALLFVGEDGVGKKLFALEIAKALNCRTPVGVEACDQCSSCVRINQSKFPEYSDDKDNKERLVRSDHPDVLLARPFTRVLRIGPMREIEQEANYRPFEGRARVFIIEEANRLNESSSNALLKTLEEPPVSSHLILITSRPAQLLPTIRSRCQVVRFAPLAPSEIEAHLLKGKQVSPVDARLLSRVARGSIGRALSTDLENYRVQREAMMEVVNALSLTHDRARLLRASEEMNDAKHKDQYEPRLDVLATIIHDVWALALGATDEQVINQDLRPQLSKVASSLEGSSSRASRWLSRIEQHRRGLDVNINRKIATDALFLTMAEA